MKKKKDIALFELIRQTGEMVGAFSELTSKMEEVKKTLRSEGEKLLKSEVDSLFKKYPELEAIGWTQFTPYFNDGDECVFSFNGLHAKVTGFESEFEEEDYGYDHVDSWPEVDYAFTKWVDDLDREPVERKHGVWDGKKYFYETYMYQPQKCVPIEGYEQIASDLQALAKALYNIEEVLKPLFGDHCQVRWYRNGVVEVDEYNHD